MIRQELKILTEKAVKHLQAQGELPDFDLPKIRIERPEKEINGDYASNLPLFLSKKAGQNPMTIAEKIQKAAMVRNSGLLEKVETAPPGFVNFFISQRYLQNQVKEILKQKEKFGSLKTGKSRKVNIEFISANPTGPLTLGNGRGGFCGDVLANVLNRAGYKAVREYYINDTGEQIRKLGHSVIGDEQAVYKGDYIEDLKKKIKEKDPQSAGEKAAGIILEEKIKPSVGKMKINFDVWFSEKELYEKKQVPKILDLLKRKSLAYEKEGAVWFKSTQFGDDKDRVLVKANGEYTYIASDAAYLKNKFDRGFEKLIFIWGADHFGYIERIKAMAEALGYEREKVDVIIMQLVSIVWHGQELKMSKREGVYRTIDELIDGLGLDVVRFFFLTRSPGNHLIFDLNLAKEKSEKNPVYYIQYAFARISSILRKTDFKPKTSRLELLKEPAELELIKQLARFDEIVEDTAGDYQIQRIPQYSSGLATFFHKFYQDCRVISEDKNLSEARLALVSAVKIVLKNSLDLMGISAPEKM